MANKNNNSTNKLWVRVVCLILAGLMATSVGYVAIQMILGK